MIPRLGTRGGGGRGFVSCLVLGSPASQPCCLLYIPIRRAALGPLVITYHHMAFMYQDSCVPWTIGAPCTAIRSVSHSAQPRSCTQASSTSGMAAGG